MKNYLILSFISVTCQISWQLNWFESSASILAELLLQSWCWGVPDFSDSSPFWGRVIEFQNFLYSSPKSHTDSLNSLVFFSQSPHAQPNQPKIKPRDGIEDWSSCAWMVDGFVRLSLPGPTQSRAIRWQWQWTSSPPPTPHSIVVIAAHRQQRNGQSWTKNARTSLQRINDRHCFRYQRRRDDPRRNNGGMEWTSIIIIIISSSYWLS